jgi:YegS/Rv2252/BmrU family lipid kinase
LSITVIVNPISGTGGRPEVARARVEQARTLLAAHGVAGTVVMTEASGHGHAVARDAVASGVDAVIAWGGDGTVNEVASALAFSAVPLAIVPSGSGNGLARELHIPHRAADAFQVAIGGTSRVIDCGEADGHLFFNIAGMGIDARVAQHFAAGGLVRRGFRRYLELTARELFRDAPEEHTVIVGGRTFRERLLVLAVANSRQYGNGAVIAPQARLDDGRLDVVMVKARAPLLALLQAPMLFMGAVNRLPGVITATGAELEISSPHAVIYHTDGEPHVGGTSVAVRVHPGALRIRVGG